MPTNLLVRLLLQLGSMTAGLCTSLLLYRLALRTLGPAVLGTWLSTSALCAQLGLLEAGLGAAMNIRTATKSGTGADPGPLLGTGLLLSLVLAGLVLGLSLVLRQLVVPLLHVAAPLRGAAREAVLWCGADLAVVFCWSGLRWGLYGGGHAELVNVLVTGRHLIYGALGWAILRRGADPCGLGRAALAADLWLGGAILCWVRCCPDLWPRRPCLAALREIRSYSSTVVVGMLGLSLARNTPLPLLQRSVGPGVVAAYAPAERLAAVCSMLLTQVCTALGPSFAAACARQRGPLLQQLLQAGRLGLAVGLPPLVTMLGLGDLLLGAWLGPELAPSAIFLRLLGLGLCAQLLGVATDIGAFAVGRRRYYGRIKLAGGAAAAALCGLGLALYHDARAAALGVGLALLLGDGVLQPITVCAELGVPARAFYSGLLARSPQTLAALAGTVWLARLLWAGLPPGGLPMMLALAGCCTILGWALCGALYLGPAERALLRRTQATHS